MVATQVVWLCTMLCISVYMLKVMNANMLATSSMSLPTCICVYMDVCTMYVIVFTEKQLTCVAISLCIRS
jgi:hypothetical protein